MSLKSLGKITVAAAGTPVVASSSSIYVSYFRVQPLATNVGNIYVGDSTLNKTTLVGAFHDGLGAGQLFECAPGSPGANPIDMALVKIDADNNNDGAVISYVQT